VKIKTVLDYYNNLAKNYDDDRFGNSYGRYLDQLERSLLREWLSQTKPDDVVDIGCGTGRLLDFAMTGLDPSQEMLKVAAAKFPNHRLVLASLPDVRLKLEEFANNVICFHVLMHLDENVIKDSFDEVRHLLRIGGHFIFDIPSADRRALFRRKPTELSWHGSTAATYDDICHLAGSQWKLVERRGLLFFPIHRLPSFSRKWFGKLDSWLGKTPLARYCSYHVYRLERVS
jgi:SAM-dependent methyltransferase